MRQGFPTNRTIKFQAKVIMGAALPAVLKVTFLVVSIQVALNLLRGALGGTLGYYLVDLSKYASSATGFFRTDQGFNIIFRLDLLNTVLAFPITYHQLFTFLLINFVIFLLMTPMKMGLLEQYWNLHQGQKLPWNRIFRWYLEPELAGKSLAVELVLNLGSRIVGILFLAPSLLLYFKLYSGSWVTDKSAVSLLGLLVFVLLIVGGLATYFVYTVLFPTRYCLVSHPEMSVKMILDRGVGCMKGYRKSFFTFRLSFILLFVLSELSYGAVDLYVAPYTNLASMEYLHQVAEVKTSDQ